VTPPKRKKTKKLFVGPVPVGGGSPVSVQSMTKTDTRDVKATVRQIRALEREGCEIVRLAVPDRAAAKSLGKIKQSVSIPVIADIHFDWRLALEAINRGVDGLRINPGNIGAKWKVKEVVSALRERKVPLRIGVNAGSLQKDLLKKYGHPVPEALVESALRHVRILEDMNYKNLKVSLKASGVLSTVEAYRLFSKKRRYPLHVGISEAGPEFSGTVKSAVGLGILLNEGIGDTVRVSLTANPVKEVRVAYEILRSLGIRQRGIDLVSCPTCGRCGVDLRSIASEVERKLRGRTEPLKVAVMGCIVNGPGEAREADLGIAAGRTKEDKLVDTLMKLVEEFK
jgi:(E)-4-hydroxy-3-methylbut-2-enyl-diphosphate synthase